MATLPKSSKFGKMGMTVGLALVSAGQREITSASSRKARNAGDVFVLAGLGETSS